MIRQIAIDELGRLEAGAREFYASSKFLRGFDPARFRSVWESLITRGIGVIFIDERDGEIVGAIGGMVSAEIYTGQTIAEELFWFVREAFRGTGVLLYRALERWARDASAVTIHMVHLLDLMPEKVGWFYLQNGFQPIETRYSKELVA